MRPGRTANDAQISLPACPASILRYLALGAALSLAGGAQTSAPGTATLDINTSVTIPIAPAFSGVSADLNLPVEYWDYRFNTLASAIGFGWVRFPGGTSSDIYDWQTGQDSQAWFAEFPAGMLNSNVISLVAGRGGARLIDAANRANFLGAPLVICVNGFTDTAASAGQLAAFVKANNIQVAAWELSNEPYLFPTFWATATDYLDAMKPYRDAIKAVLPNSLISIFVTDQGHANAASNPWNVAVSAYPNKYWDAISFHHYPPQSSGAFAQWMADESAVLASKTTSVITATTQLGPAGVKFLNTEFDPSLPNDSSTGASSDYRRNSLGRHLCRRIHPADVHHACLAARGAERDFFPVGRIRLQLTISRTSWPRQPPTCPSIRSR